VVVDVHDHVAGMLRFLQTSSVQYSHTNAYGVRYGT
jgi:hypothetical protein